MTQRKVKDWRYEGEGCGADCYLKLPSVIQVTFLPSVLS